MLAELNGKLGGDNIMRSERLEDELTGNFFGTIRYIPYNTGLKKVLAYAQSNDKRFLELLSNVDAEEFEIKFWERTDEGEIDAYIDTGCLAIGVEVKYFSDLSGENQLEREASMMQEWRPGEESILLFVAPRSAAQATYLNNFHKECFRKVHLGYLIWEDVILGLEDITTDNYFEKVIVNDLKQLMFAKAFVKFEGFKLSITEPIAKDAYYQFNVSNRIWPNVSVHIAKDAFYRFAENTTSSLFTNIRREVERGLYYEFR